MTFLAHFLIDFACRKMVGKIESGGHMTVGHCNWSQVHGT